MTDDIIYPEDLVAQIKNKSPQVNHIPISTLKTWPKENLVAIRDAIDRILPHKSLSDLNLEEEAVAQLRVTKTLQSDIIDDPDIPANQKAQVINATASAIQNLVRMQVDLKRDEQLKRMEHALLKAISTLPSDTQNDFFKTYELLAISAGVDTGALQK